MRSQRALRSAAARTEGRPFPIRFAPARPSVPSRSYPMTLDPNRPAHGRACGALTAARPSLTKRSPQCSGAAASGNTGRSRGISRVAERLLHDLQRMPGPPGGSVDDLLAAGDGGRRDDGAGGLRPDGREQPLLAEAHGRLVMLLLVADGSRHATAPGVNADDVYAWNAA